ncbi:uncharacterized protein LOC120679326 isoform X7 [Panicum virgatum]|uniref:uncharacterized protein LOC120679326 isoform X7 n=1 Tax=Panicum virgatum TaxID=38727 RepID=UPI0019D66184|nr:uncharacterized protein LOC120679326 isoform X7 [Panicum virgatum]
MSSTAFAPSTRADARTAPLPAARLAWPRDAPRTAARASPARWRHPTPAVLLFARGVRKMERALPATTMREMLPRTSSTTTYKATQTVLHQLYEMNPPSYTWLYNYVSLGWTIRWRLFPSPARNGEAGLGLVSDDHTPSPIRQMDQDGSGGSDSGAATSDQNSCGQLLFGLHLRQQKSDAWDLESASTSTLQLWHSD